MESLLRWLPGADDAADKPRPRPDDGLWEHLGDSDESPRADSRPLPVAWALPACAATLTRAGAELRRLPVDVRIAGLARVARSWLDPDDDSRREALGRLPDECGLSERMVAWGLDRAFEVVEPIALRRWWDAEGADVSPATLSGHVLASNVFVAGLPPVVASVLAGVPALVKAPAGQPTFAALLARSFALHAPELGPCVGAAAWGRDDDRATAALLEAARVVFVFGDDDSVTALQTSAPSGTDILGFGHRVSLAVVTSEALDGDLDPVLDGLAEDCLAWDGGGCLTPRWIFVEGDAGRTEALARSAAARIEPVVNALPARPLSAGAGAERVAWLAEAAFAGWSAHGPGWGVASLPDVRILPAPPPRVMCFCALPDAERLEALLQPLGPRLQALAVAGPPARHRSLEDRLAPAGVSRVVVPGQLQRPAVDWNHDDVRILSSLR